MSDPTESVIIASFCTALGVFMLTAIGRKIFEGKQETGPLPAPPFPDEEISLPARPDSPYQPPTAVTPPPATPQSGIPIAFYRPLDLLGVGLIFLVFFTLVVGSVQMAASGKETDLDPSGLISSIIFQFVSAAIVTGMVFKRIRPIAWLGLRWRNWPWVSLIAPGAVLGMWLIFGGLQASGYMEWIESLGCEPMQETVKLLQDSTDPTLIGLMIFAAVIAAPFCEEIVFRGYLYTVGKRFAGPWIGAFCSALIFSAAHGSVAALLPLFIFGLVQVFIYEKTGSIWAPIAVHLLFNGATVLVQLAPRFGYPIDASL
ncbi:CPBP family intramembrane metalloprotease [Luteolibacter yonseiensis]|uniref:CPBP family intramembrane metalloprotease n=1 Tax=Luteolibacter yonseiensis TaxID=1144680 RepID=A0A934R1U6_9BACT|nr:type II CAAX endopeptidase family protein [Luteolibacter yonseiensis]MBK1815411.1 CPBP family intramembrane metalloprotease [Luteolibacter yonseiensis]